MVHTFYTDMLFRTGAYMVCNKSRSRDYSTQSLIIVSLTLSLAKIQGSQSLAKTQGSVYVRITQHFM